MKRIAFGICALALIAMISTTASASTFVSDTFDYPAGVLTSTSGGLWGQHSTGTNDVLTDGAGNTTSVNGVSGSDVNRDAVNSAGLHIIGGGNETWYYAGLVTINDTRATPLVTPLESQSYILHFKDSGTFNFVTRAHVTDPSGGLGNPGFRFGLSAGSGNFASATQDLNFGQQYKVMGSFNATTGDAQLWVDPANIGSTSIAATDPGRIGTLIQALGIRQDSGGGPTFDAVIDSIAFGDDFDSVMINSMNGSNIPEPTSLALALLGLAGIASSRRRS